MEEASLMNSKQYLLVMRCFEAGKLDILTQKPMHLNMIVL